MEIKLKRLATVRKLLIDSSNIKNFHLLENRRKLRENAVKKLLEKLNRQDSFEAPFVLSERKNGEYNLIDGNHRIAAIEKWLEENPDGSIEIWAFVYPGLSKQEEKKMYTEWNQGSKQSTNDFVQQYAEEIPLIDQLPFCTIYGEKETIPFFRLVSAYLAAQAPKFQGGYLGTPWQFVEIAKSMNGQEVNDLTEFMDIFINSFGPLDEKYNINGKTKINPFKKTTPLTALMKIWYANRSRINNGEVIKAFKKLLSDARVNELLSLSGMSACKYAHLQLLNILNENLSMKFKE